MVDQSNEAAAPPLVVSRWPSERPLFVLVLMVSLGFWCLLAVSIVGLLYAVLIGIFFGIAHLIFIAHLRGSAVRLGPEQLPELYGRVQELAGRLRMRKTPEAYLLQAGGTLNALATKFMRSSFIVLYAELLEACGENPDARDFIIAHELAHLKAGHLRWRWLLLPGMFIPFLGHAYSQAREYTCDRYGIAVSRDRTAALEGLVVLAAGGKHAPMVNRRALVEQRRDLNTGLMKIGEWLSTHPPIAHRLAEIKPALLEGGSSGRFATAKALALIAAFVLIPTTLGLVFAQKLWPTLRERLKEAQSRTSAGGSSRDETYAQIYRDISALAEVAEFHRQRSGAPPADTEALAAAWIETHPDRELPRDPQSNLPYRYDVEGEHYLISSIGIDPDTDADDIYFSSRQALVR
ncbi:MAG: M48 family metallopeptidase [Deltaproteobacteria bacterium]|nr:M48 family metallopeptidase [Deltaproteobacteria bacterium]